MGLSTPGEQGGLADHGRRTPSVHFFPKLHHSAPGPESLLAVHLQLSQPAARGRKSSGSGCGG